MERAEIAIGGTWSAVGWIIGIGSLFAKRAGWHDDSRDTLGVEGSHGVAVEVGEGVGGNSVRIGRLRLER